MSKTKRQSAINMRGVIPIGTRVLLIGTHPWAGHTGEIVRWEVVGMFASEGPKPVIKLDSGNECFAMSAADFGVLPKGGITHE